MLSQLIDNIMAEARGEEGTSSGIDPELEAIITSFELGDSVVPFFQPNNASSVPYPSITSHNSQINSPFDHLAFLNEAQTTLPTVHPINTIKSPPSLSAYVPYTPSTDPPPSLSTLSSCATPTNSTPASLAVPVPEVPFSIISRQPFSGHVGFSAEVEAVSMKWKFENLEQEKVLFTKPEVFVPIVFKSTDGLPSECVIRALVVYKDSTVLSNVATIDDGRFIDSKSSLSTYKGHHCVVFTVSELPASGESHIPMGMVKFNCTSAQLNTKGGTIKKGSSLLLIFQLLLDDEVIGVDVFNLKVCFSVKRDYDRRRKLLNPIPNPVPKRRSSKRCHSDVMDLSKINPQLDLTDGVKPDTNGEYTFTWKGRDRGMLNLFMMLERAYSLR